MDAKADHRRGSRPELGNDLVEDPTQGLHNARPRAGSCLDLLKCFSTLPRQPLLYLLQKLGTPEHIVRTWRTWLSASTRTLIVNREPGPFCPSTTGCAEGDPLSVAAIVALGYLWYVVVHAQGVQPYVLIDNLEFTANSGFGSGVGNIQAIA